MQFTPHDTYKQLNTCKHNKNENQSTPITININNVEKYKERAAVTIIKKCVFYAIWFFIVGLMGCEDVLATSLDMSSDPSIRGPHVTLTLSEIEEVLLELKRCLHVAAKFDELTVFLKDMPDDEAQSTFSAALEHWLTEVPDSKGLTSNQFLFKMMCHILEQCKLKE